MPYNDDQSNTLATIVAKCTDAHWVLCNEDKTPAKGKWEKNAPTMQEVAGWQSLLGIIPASIGCMVFDIDIDDEKIVNWICDEMPPDFRTVSMSGKAHLWYRVSDKIIEKRGGNTKLRYQDDDGNEQVIGDIRCARGYIVLANPTQGFDELPSIKPRAEIETAIENIITVGFDRGNKTAHNELMRSMVYEFRTGGDGSKTVAKARASEPPIPEKEIQEALTWCQNKIESRRVKGLPYSADMLKMCLDTMGIKLAFDEVAQSDLYYYPDEGWIPPNAHQEAHLRDAIRNNCDFVKGKDKNTGASIVEKVNYSENRWHEARKALSYTNRQSLVKDFIEKLPPPTDEDKARFDRYLTDIFGVDTELSRFVGRAIFIGLVQRILQPGARVRLFPVLVGAKGVGKSAFVKSLLWPEWRELFFMEGFDMKASDKDKVHDIKGKILIEMSEMDGANKTDHAKLKSFLTRTKYDMALKYERDARQILATAHFIGTSNDCAFLPVDDAAACRFAPIELPGKQALVKPEEYLDKHRNALWSAAVDAVKNGAQLEHVESDIMKLVEVAVNPYKWTDELVRDTAESLLDEEHGMCPWFLHKGITMHALENFALTKTASAHLPSTFRQRIREYLQSQGWDYKRKSVGYVFLCKNHEEYEKSDKPDDYDARMVAHGYHIDWKPTRSQEDDALPERTF